VGKKKRRRKQEDTVNALVGVEAMCRSARELVRNEDSATSRALEVTINQIEIVAALLRSHLEDN